MIRKGIEFAQSSDVQVIDLKEGGVILGVMFNKSQGMVALTFKNYDGDMSDLTEEEADRLAKTGMEGAIVFGSELDVEMLIEALYEARAMLQDMNKPIDTSNPNIN